MPNNFQRHNIEERQRCSNDNSYFVSEKMDGVRYIMTFTGSTVVLLDRSNKGYQPRSITTTNGEGNDTDEPMKSLLHMVQPGTVLDGEVVLHRELRRPIFIVFDVLCS
jgi:ATP-dependent DNA ligase